MVEYLFANEVVVSSSPIAEELNNGLMEQWPSG